MGKTVHTIGTAMLLELDLECSCVVPHAGPQSDSLTAPGCSAPWAVAIAAGL